MTPWNDFRKTVVALMFLLASCDYISASAEHESERERIFGKISIGMPLDKVRNIIVEETGVSKWDGFWDYPDEESGNSVAVDCPYVGTCAIEPDLQLGQLGEKVDWRRFLVIQAYHEPPSMSGPGNVMYLVFDRRTKLLQALVFWPKGEPSEY